MYARAGKTFAHARERLIQHTKVGRTQIVRNSHLLAQIGARLIAECLDVQRRATFESAQRPHGVDAPDEAAHPFQRFRVIKFRRPTAAPSIERKPEIAEAMQGRCC